jgi:ubiquinone/menaquinone biosynthesis C-methylase UbiE
MQIAYLMESKSEGTRLEGKDSPHSVRDQLNVLGLQPGMRVLDAGAGTGSAARVMADLVGPEGGVVALDFSGDRVRYGAEIASRSGRGRMQFVQGQLAPAPLKPGTFDMVWCRFVFEYLRSPEAVIVELMHLLKPGGKLAVLDLDNNGQIHYPFPPEVEQGVRTLTGALGGVFDPFVGRKLYWQFRNAGLERIKVHILPYHVYAGAAPASDLDNWQQKFATIRRFAVPAFGSEHEYDCFVRAYLDMLRDPDTFTYSTLFIVEGIRRDRD